MNVNLNYSAIIEFDGEVYQVTLPDIENGFTFGETLEKAIFNAQDLLGQMLKSLKKDNATLPLPSKLNNNYYIISPFPEVAVPLELFLLRKQQGKTVEEVANLLGMSKQRYSDIEKGKNLTLKTLRKVTTALGANAQICLVVI